MAEVVDRQSVAASSRQQRVSLNNSDLVELLPGAQPSANPAERERFEARCRQVHAEDRVAETHSPSEEVWNANRSSADSRFDDLMAMFPALEPSLIAAIASEARSQQGAIETLLLLNAAAEGTGSTPSPSPKPGPRTDDYEAFPVMLDADGWQVCTSRAEPSQPEDKGTSWSDRAKAVAATPAPKVAAKASPAPTRRRRAAAEGKDDVDECEVGGEYELRHALGRRREQRKGRLGRRGAAKAAAGTAPGATIGSESESSQDSDGEGTTP